MHQKKRNLKNLKAIHFFSQFKKKVNFVKICQRKILDLDLLSLEKDKFYYEGDINEKKN